MSIVKETMEFVKSKDEEIGAALEREYQRQKDNIELIASENIVSEAVMMAMGSVATNKYAEGYSGKRYYGGCQCIDEIETIAIERVKKIIWCRICECSAAFWCLSKLSCRICRIKAR